MIGGTKPWEVGKFYLSVYFLFEQNSCLTSAFIGKSSIPLRIAIVILHVCFLFWMRDYYKKKNPSSFPLLHVLWFLAQVYAIVTKLYLWLGLILEVSQLYPYEQHHFGGRSFELLGFLSHFHSCKPLWWELYMLLKIFLNQRYKTKGKGEWEQRQQLKETKEDLIIQQIFVTFKPETLFFLKKRILI